MDNISNFYGCFIMLWIIPTCINLCIYTALYITCKRITDNKCFIFIKVFNMSKTVIKKLFSSIPFDVYLLIFVLALFKISIPQPILSVASFIGAGNGFLAMFMIGLLLEVKINPSEMKIVLKTLLIRVLFGAILMSIVYFIVPIPMLAKKIVILAMAAPITTVSAVFSKNIGYHRDAPAISSSLSIIISIAVLVVLIIMFA